MVFQVYRLLILHNRSTFQLFYQSFSFLYWGTCDIRNWNRNKQKTGMSEKAIKVITSLSFESKHKANFIEKWLSGKNYCSLGTQILRKYV